MCTTLCGCLLRKRFLSLSIFCIVNHALTLDLNDCDSIENMLIVAYIRRSMMICNLRNPIARCFLDLFREAIAWNESSLYYHERYK